MVRIGEDEKQRRVKDVQSCSCHTAIIIILILFIHVGRYVGTFTHIFTRVYLLNVLAKDEHLSKYFNLFLHCPGNNKMLLI